VEKLTQRRLTGLISSGLGRSFDEKQIMQTTMMTLNAEELAGLTGACLHITIPGTQRRRSPDVCLR
jgi:hypothetical protein